MEYKDYIVLSILILVSLTIFYTSFGVNDIMTLKVSCFAFGLYFTVIWVSKYMVKNVK